MPRSTRASEKPDLSHNPVSRVIWVPVEKVRANDYNPNAVASSEMQLLYISILHDGFTQPVVTFRDDAQDCWIIVDGFHRYLTMKQHPDIYRMNGGLLPIVVIDKPINDRMASTIRHNRARGRHGLDGMSALVVDMLNQGWPEDRICKEIGIEPEELLRLKHVTGYAKFFLDHPYSRAVETPVQIKERLKFEGSGSPAGQPGGASPPPEPTS